MPDGADAPASERPLALITGASAGIGKLFAHRLASLGHDVLLVARDAARLEAVADELTRQFGVGAATLPADLARDDGMRAVAERITKEDRLAFLVNNAGFGTKGLLVNRPVAEQATMVKLHVMAPMLLTRAALPGLIARGKGTIINVSSVASYVYGMGNVNYCATKAYLRFFTEALALELDGTGVHAQALCPGFTYTEFHDRAGIDRTQMPRWMWMNAERVVDESLAQAARNGRTVCIPGLRYRVIVFLVKYLPEWIKSGARARYGKART
jgi:hypothetical protein